MLETQLGLSGGAIRETLGDFRELILDFDEGIQHVGIEMFAAAFAHRLHLLGYDQCAMKAQLLGEKAGKGYGAGPKPAVLVDVGRKPFQVWRDAPLDG